MKMKKLFIFFLSAISILLVIAFIIGGSIMSSYNSLVSMNQEVDSLWANVESNYQRRFDLIGNLASSVKGYLKQEQKVFGDIAEARTKYSGASGANEKAEAASGLDGALARLMVIMENYPELKSDETVKNLMDELAGTENRINVERIRYNSAVKYYNIKVKRFPDMFIANIFNFKEREMFESSEGAEKVPVVDLNVE